MLSVLLKVGEPRISVSLILNRRWAIPKPRLAKWYLRLDRCINNRIHSCHLSYQNYILSSYHKTKLFISSLLKIMALLGLRHLPLLTLALWALTRPSCSSRNSQPPPISLLRMDGPTNTTSTEWPQPIRILWDRSAVCRSLGSPRTSWHLGN